MPGESPPLKTRATGRLEKTSSFMAGGGSEVGFEMRGGTYPGGVVRWRMMAREMTGPFISDAGPHAMDFCSIGRSKLKWEFIRPRMLHNARGVEAVTQRPGVDN